MLFRSPPGCPNGKPSVSLVGSCVTVTSKVPMLSRAGATASGEAGVPACSESPRAIGSSVGAFGEGTDALSEAAPELGEPTEDDASDTVWLGAGGAAGATGADGVGDVDRVAVVVPGPPVSAGSP